MIEIKFNDFCSGCKIADLKLVTHEGGVDEKFYALECRHARACMKMNRQTNEEWTRKRSDA